MSASATRAFFFCFRMEARRSPARSQKPGSISSRGRLRSSVRTERGRAGSLSNSVRTAGGSASCWCSSADWITLISSPSRLPGTPPSGTCRPRSSAILAKAREIQRELDAAAQVRDAAEGVAGRHEPQTLPYRLCHALPDDFWARSRSSSGMCTVILRSAMARVSGMPPPSDPRDIRCVATPA
jgi:hypothetical protein